MRGAKLARNGSIRVRITTLLAVPLAALVGMWAFAVVTVMGDLQDLRRASESSRHFAARTDTLAQDVQEERLATVRWLTTAVSVRSRNELQEARTNTDGALKGLRQEITQGHLGLLTSDQRHSFTDMLAATDPLASVRQQVSDRGLSWQEAMRWYNELVEPTFQFRTTFDGLRAGRLAERSAVLTGLSRAHEYVSQEEAALTGLQATSRPKEDQYRLLDSALESQRLLFSLHEQALAGPDRRPYDAFMRSRQWSELRGYENAFFSSETDSSRHITRIASWRAAASQVGDQLGALNGWLATNIARQGDRDASDIIRRAVLAGAVGLSAVALTVVLSSRIGRGLVRELVVLRDAAKDLADTRLPAVMARLRQGEFVDIAAAAPPLDYGRGEIGQVGEAFDSVQRAAVEAAVQQAEIRRAAASVFVNLARRTQTLVHRQLTVLDAMERRTEDPDDLGDLFRLDHLATRMRRHAEGLVVLSGGPAGRLWRDPVRMLDVVRAAVAEVEHYTRVMVHGLPGIRLDGPLVTDVTHLLAELVENATVWSPPHTQVTIAGEVVSTGFVLEISDRGLGMTPTAREEFNRRLREDQEFKLIDAAQLGLFVVGQLAHRHGIGVVLRPSPYGGISAIVFLPNSLLAGEETAAAEESAAARKPAPGRAELPSDALEKRSFELRHTSGRPGTPAEGGTPPSAADEAGRPPLPSRTGGTPSRPAHPHRTPRGRHRRGGTHGAHPPHSGATAAPEPGRTPAGAEQPASRRQPSEEPGRALVTPAEQDGELPRRIPQTHLTARLRDTPPTAARPADGAPAARPLRPEQARATFGAFHRGTMRGRNPTPPRPDSAPPTAPHERASAPSNPARGENS